MICEMSETCGSILSQNMKNEDFDRLMKQSVYSSLLHTDERHSLADETREDFEYYNPDQQHPKQLSMDI